MAHPYLDEGRLRYHSCMCKCCYTTSAGMRQYTADFEPAAAAPFDDLWERKLTSVQQVKGKLKTFEVNCSISFNCAFNFNRGNAQIHSWAITNWPSATLYKSTKCSIQKFCQVRMKNQYLFIYELMTQLFLLYNYSIIYKKKHFETQKIN